MIAFDPKELPEWAEGAVILEGLDDAIIGIGQQWGSNPCMIYSVQKIIDILVKRDEMDPDDAVEYYEFNIMQLYAGEQTPVMMMEGVVKEVNNGVE